MLEMIGTFLHYTFWTISPLPSTSVEVKINQNPNDMHVRDSRDHLALAPLANQDCLSKYVTFTQGIIS